MDTSADSRRLVPRGPDAFESLLQLSSPPSVTFLVPSDKEDYRTILQTLFSAALQRFEIKAGDTAAVAFPLADCGLVQGRLSLPSRERHTDALFRRITFRDPTRWHQRKALQLQLTVEYRKLMALFTFVNTYIGLMGGRWRDRRSGDSLHLLRSEGQGSFLIPETDYVDSLDADSLLLPDYTAKLVQSLEHPDNARVAVAQTSYSAIPGPSSLIERIAGATTDIQHIIHQGFTHFGATCWVRANAVLRKKALDNIRMKAEERGYPIVKFIQDRTVIEDTESTIDLVDRGWRPYNHPERLAYSASLADSGLLLIQRKRWANGGLLIAAKLVRHLAGHIGRPVLVNGVFFCGCRFPFRS